MRANIKNIMKGITDKSFGSVDLTLLRCLLFYFFIGITTPYLLESVARSAFFFLLVNFKTESLHIVSFYFSELPSL